MQWKSDFKFLYAFFQHELEVEASKPSVTKVDVKDVCPIESKQMSIAQIIYSENRVSVIKKKKKK